MATGIIPGTGDAARADTNRDAVSPSSLPQWMLHPGGRVAPLAALEWWRFDNSTLQKTPWQSVPYPFPPNASGANSPIYNVDRDTLARNAIALAGTTHYGGAAEKSVAFGQCGFAVRQSGSWLIFHGAGHGVGIANMVLGYQLGLDNPVWSELSSCSDYVEAMGARQSSTSVAPATYVSGTSGAIAAGDISTGYMFGNGTNKFWTYFHDGKPVIGHTGYGNLYDDARDRMIRTSSGVAWWGQGGSNQIDVFDWPTKTWRTPNRSANAFNPQFWTSDAGNIVTGSNGHSWTHGACIDPATGDLYWMDSVPSMVWARWDSANNRFVNTRITRLTLNQTTNNGATEPMVVVRAGGRNIVYYMDCTNVSGRQRYKLRRVDITNTLTGGSPIAMTAIDVSGISFTHPVANDPNRVYQTQAGMIYEPVRDKLIYIDPGFTDLAADNASFNPGAYVHLYEIPLEGANNAVQATELTTTGTRPPMVPHPTISPDGVQSGIWTNTYISALGGIAVQVGYAYNARTNPTSGVGAIYFIKTH
jgi:hypothetical protein